MDEGRSTSLRQGRVPRDISESLGKMPPQALDLEETILGAIMVASNSDEVTKVMQFLKPEHFYHDGHREIYQAIVDLKTAGSPVDMRSVKYQLQKTGKLEIVGGGFAIAEITANVSSAANIEHHCAIVYEKYLKRELIVMASTVHQSAYEDDSDVFSMMDEYENAIRAMKANLPGGNEVKIGDEVYKITQEIQGRTDEVLEITGVPSGFTQLDKITMGFQKGDLIIIAGRPSMGKTALAVCAGLNAAVDFKVPVGIFSLEMPARQLALRMASVKTGMNMKTLRTKKFNPMDWENFIQKTSKLAGSEIYIDDKAALHINELRSRARRMVARHNVQMIIIDYCQLMKGDTKFKSREQEISSISAGCKQLAKELDIPVILLSQLSRDVEKRGGLKIPMLADLRDSGSLEQDADVIIFPWRPGYYKIDGDYHEGRDRIFIQGLTKLFIAKHRNGELGEPFLKFVNYLTAFENTDYCFEDQVPISTTVDVPHTEVTRTLPPATDKVNPANPNDPPF